MRYRFLSGVRLSGMRLFLILILRILILIILLEKIYLFNKIYKLLFEIMGGVRITHYFSKDKEKIYI